MSMSSSSRSILRKLVGGLALALAATVGGVSCGIWLGDVHAAQGGAAVVANTDGRPSAAAPPSPAADATLSAEPFVAAAAKVRPGVAAVGSYLRTDTPSVRYAGTGFVIGDGTVVVTNAHVLEALRQIDRLNQLRVFFPDSTPVDGRKASVWGEDSFHDVALLKLEGAPAPALELALEHEPAQGQAVGVMGYPIGMALGLVPAVHKGVVAAVVPAVLPLPKGAKLTPQLAEAIKQPYNLYQLDMVVYPGNSGSPLFAERDGKVMGIINKTLATGTREHLLTEPSGVSYAVPIRWAQELLRRCTAESGGKAPAPGPDHP
jgi:serine protease Do